MPKFELTNKAVEDLTSIWDYTLYEWSEDQAEKYYNEIISTCKKLSENQNLGKNYNRISKDIFGYRVGKHIVFYRIRSTQKIEITRILHGMMDLENRMKE